MKPAWRKSPPAKRVPFNLYIDPGVRDAAREIAGKKGYSLSEYVENLLWEEFEIDRLEASQQDYRVVANLISGLREYPLSDRLSFDPMELASLKNHDGVVQFCYKAKRGGQRGKQ